MVSDLVFNRSACSRLLSVTVDAIAKFEVWANCVFVQLKGQRPTFISKSRFKAEFTRFRREGAKSCLVKQNGPGCYPGTFTVKSETRYHSVRLTQTLQTCDCQDYKAQLGQEMTDRLCKHLLAVVNYLGFGSLDACILNAQAAAAKSSIYPERLGIPVRPPIQVNAPQLPSKFAHVSII